MSFVRDFVHNRAQKNTATEKGVIPVLDAGIHLRKSLCCKEIDYRLKPDNDNFRSFSVASILKFLFIRKRLFIFFQSLNARLPQLQFLLLSNRKAGVQAG